MAKILIVDDRVENREYLVTLLGYHRYRLLEASSGAQALAIARVEHPDLVISEILMPTMDGYEFVRQLRADAALAATPVIFFTAHYHGPEAEKLAKGCGVAYILTKPAEPEDVLRTVAEALGQKELPASPPPLEFDREHLQILTDKVSEQVERLRRLNERFAALNDVNLKLASERDPRRLLDSVCDAARELTAAKYALLAVEGTGEAGGNEFTASGLEPQTVTRIGHPRWGESPARTALSQGKALRIRNPGGQATAVGLPALQLPMYSLLVAPIVSPAHNYGWIALSDKLGATEFSADDELLVAALGALLGRFYENGTLLRELLASEAGLSRAQLMAKLAHVITRPDGSFESWSETLPKLIGADRAQMPGSTRQWLEIVHPEDRPVFRATAMQAGIEGTRKELEYRLKGADRAWIHVWQVFEPIQGAADADGRVRWFNTLQDVTEQKQAENRIKRLNRVYSVLSGINTTIVRVRDRGELFRDVCRIAVDAGQFRLAWIGIADHEAKRLNPVAWHGVGEGYIELMPLGLDENQPESFGLAGRAVKERRPMMSDDMARDPRVLLADESSRRGLHSLVVLPVAVEGKVSCVLALYSEEIAFFDAEEMKLLLELAGDISFALDGIAKEEKLDYLAFYDPLTGVPNRALFRERLNQRAGAADHAEHRLAVVLLNIERFHTVNDTLGRQTGDELLKQIAGRCLRFAADPALFARPVGDQFGMLIPDVASEANAARILEQWNRDVFSSSYRVGEHELRVSAKFGIAMFPGDGTNADSLLKNAEAALMRAKATGERYLFYNQQMTERVAGRLTLENKLRDALEKDEFVLHYQPKVDVKTQRIVGIEALMRWQSADLGLVPPGRFIPLLEESGMIVDVGAWAIRKALADRREWHSQGLQPPSIAVNVSSIQLRQNNFVDVVRKAIEDSRATPHGLDMEITESLLMEDIEGNVKKLKALRDMDINIAIDDFGTGYSSLGYLARLPVNTLKIDRSFITSMTKEADSMTIVSTIVSLAHSLKMKVVAEGVETEEQSRYLRLLKCDEMQGYLFSKPLPASALTKMLGKHRAT